MLGAMIRGKDVMARHYLGWLTAARTGVLWEERDGMTSDALLQIVDSAESPAVWGAVVLPGLGGGLRMRSVGGRTMLGARCKPARRSRLYGWEEI